MSAGIIRPRERDAIIQSLRAGVVPRAGQQHIQVGRVEEVKSLIADLDRIADGGSCIRFIIGEFGSGKTFFLFLIRSIALEKKLVTLHADLTPDRRFHGTSGQARGLYQELVRNMSTRAKSDGSALPSVVERFITSAIEIGQQAGVKPDVVIHERLSSLTEMLNGYDFADVIRAYWRGHDTGNDTLKSDALRWLRGDFSSSMDARAGLGVRSIIDDSNVYDQLKLLARFIQLAGFAGTLVCCDELTTLYKLSNADDRNNNYELILHILNDALQGSAERLGFVMGGTPDFLTDPERGLYSSESLRSRLGENKFATNEFVDYSGPVLRLAGLTPEDLYVLLTKLRHVYAAGQTDRYLIPDDGLQAFMEYCSNAVGDAYFRTPRNTVTAFLNLLAVLEQNPEASWQDVLDRVRITAETNPDLQPLADQEI